MKLKMEELVPLIVEVISSGASFRLYPNGQSMLPTIVAGEDSVELSSPENLKKYDIVLYKRDNGQYVLHRIVHVFDDSFDMCGDNQLEIEKNVRKTDVIALATAIYKGEKRISADSAELLRKTKRLYRQKNIRRGIMKIKKMFYPAYKAILKK